MAGRNRKHRESALQRRQALLQAGMELAAERGLAGVTHRALASRAHVSLGTTSYFFASLDDLLVEAVRHYVSIRAAELEALAASLRDAGASAGDVAAQFAAAITGDDATPGLAQIETYLHASRHPELRPVIAEALEAFERVAEAALRAAGARNPKEGARAAVALADGFLLHHLANPQPDDEAALRAALRLLFQTSRTRDE